MNATLKATLGGLADETQRVDDLSIRLRGDLRPSSWRKVAGELAQQLCLPEVDEKALAGLKFSEALPRPLAVATLATRLADLDHARSMLTESCRFGQLACCFGIATPPQGVAGQCRSTWCRTHGPCADDLAAI